MVMTHSPRCAVDRKCKVIDNASHRRTDFIVSSDRDRPHNAALLASACAEAAHHVRILRSGA
jgi:hypothetical protein